ncbi:MAG: hypothetical protein KGM47_13160 [Acidobacteriota bacterium]|nr:hypothetical protein [Acidobacteriota bacterium]
MEFTVDAPKFAEALDQIQGAVEKKNTIPILSHCVVEAEPKGLRLSATDLEVGIRLFCPAQVKEAGSGAMIGRHYDPICALRRTSTYEFGFNGPLQLHRRGPPFLAQSARECGQREFAMRAWRPASVNRQA